MMFLQTQKGTHIEFLITVHTLLVALNLHLLVSIIESPYLSMICFGILFVCFCLQVDKCF